MIQLPIQQGMKTKGIHTISVCDSTSEKARRIIRDIQELIEKRTVAIKIGRERMTQGLIDLLHTLAKDYRLAMIKLESIALRNQVVVENITTTVGRSVFMQRLAGTTTYTGTVNYTALGSSATAPAVGNTTLGTEVYRKAISSATYASNIAYLETFFTAAETSGTYEEYGNFIDGTGSANTGQMFNRFIQTITKSVTETLNVQSTISANDA